MYDSVCKLRLHDACFEVDVIYMHIYIYPTWKILVYGWIGLKQHHVLPLSPGSYGIWPNKALCGPTPLNVSLSRLLVYLFSLHSGLYWLWSLPLSLHSCFKYVIKLRKNWMKWIDLISWVVAMHLEIQKFMLVFKNLVWNSIMEQIECNFGH